METLRNIIDKYYNQVENHTIDKVSEDLLGTKYIINKDIGEGTISRIAIERGIELSIWESLSNINRTFDNREFNNNIIEIGYCYNGSLRVEAYPCKKVYEIQNGELSFYRRSNKVDYFEFQYNDFCSVSIHIDLDIVKENLNPILRDKAIEELDQVLEKVFKEDILIIEDAPCNIKILIETIKNTPSENMIDYVKLKAKVMELLVKSLQYATNILNKKFKLTREEINSVYKGETILLENLQNPPSVNDLSKELNMTVYKLQKGFKQILGNTVYEHVKKLRIGKSKILLKNTNMSIISIANEVGYENPSKFSSVFKAYMNVTPSEYRQKY